MANALLDILGGVGNVLSLPGQALRGSLSSALSGFQEPFFQLKSGQELLGLGEDTGMGGTIAGIGADIATDPLTYALGPLVRALRGAKAAPAVASASAIPESSLGAALEGAQATSPAFRDVLPRVRELRAIMGNDQQARQFFDRWKPSIMNPKTSTSVDNMLEGIVSGNFSNIDQEIKHMANLGLDFKAADLLAALREKKRMFKEFVQNATFDWRPTSILPEDYYASLGVGAGGTALLAALQGMNNG